MPNRSVLTGSVERLEHNEYAMGVVRVQPGLVLGQQVDARRQQLLTLPLRADLERWVEVLLQRHF